MTVGRVGVRSRDDLDPAWARVGWDGPGFLVVTEVRSPRWLPTAKIYFLSCPRSPVDCPGPHNILIQGGRPVVSMSWAWGVSERCLGDGNTNVPKELKMIVQTKMCAPKVTRALSGTAKQLSLEAAKIS